MKLKIKNIDISSGGKFIAVLHHSDAEKMDIHSADRIKISKGDSIETVSVNLAQNGDMVKEGAIGLFSEVGKALNLKDNETVTISLARKPLSIEYIRRKLDGRKLGKKEIDQIIWDITHNKLSDIELTYFVAACSIYPLSFKEIMILTRAMSDTGLRLHFDSTMVIDKHCIGR